MLLFNQSFVSNSLWPHRLQHAKFPCPSLSPRVYANLTSIELVMPSDHFILCRTLFQLPSIFPSIRVFSNESALHIRWPKYWSFSFLASVFPVIIQDWFTLGLTGLISLQSKGLSRVFSNTTVQKHHSWVFNLLYGPTLHPYMTTGKTALFLWTFVSKVMLLLFNMWSRFVIAFLPRSRHLNFMATVSVCSDFWSPPK